MALGWRRQRRSPHSARTSPSSVAARRGRALRRLASGRRPGGEPFLFEIKRFFGVAGFLPTSIPPTGNGHVLLISPAADTRLTPLAARPVSVWRGRSWARPSAAAAAPLRGPPAPIDPSNHLDRDPSDRGVPNAVAKSPPKPGRPSVLVHLVR